MIGPAMRLYRCTAEVYTGNSMSADSNVNFHICGYLHSVQSHTSHWMAQNKDRVWIKKDSALWLTLNVKHIITIWLMMRKQGILMNLCWKAEAQRMTWHCTEIKTEANQKGQHFVPPLFALFWQQQRHLEKIFWSAAGRPPATRRY